MSRAQINKLQIPWHKCLVDPNQLVLMTSFVFFFLSSVMRFIMQECGHTCTLNSTVLTVL